MNWLISKNVYGNLFPTRSKRLWIALLQGCLIYAIIGIAPLALADEVVENPIGSESFLDLINRVAEALRLIALVFAPLALIFAGLKFISAGSAGKEQELTNARKMFFWILIGTAVVVGATTLVNVVVNFAKNL